MIQTPTKDETMKSTLAKQPLQLSSKLRTLTSLTAFFEKDKIIMPGPSQDDSSLMTSYSNNGRESYMIEIYVVDRDMRNVSKNICR